MLTTYGVSKKEVNRRKMAFFSLSIFLISGFISASILFSLTISIFVYLGLIMILFLSNLLILKFFKHFLKMKISLSKEFLIRTNGKTSDKFIIKNINKVRIKRTTKNTIREIGIYFKNGKSIFINGLANFYNFKINIIKKINKKAIIKDIREPMDFDSIFFYPILGILISFGTVYLFKWLTSLDYQSIKIFLGAVLFYVFLVDLYLIISKPISKRYRL